MKIDSIVCSSFLKEHWFEIAKKIDKNFIGSENTFKFYRYKYYYFLSTGKCDKSCLIKVYTKGIGISKIMIFSEQTGIVGRHTDEDDWQEIYDSTYEEIKNLTIINNLL